MSGQSWAQTTRVLVMAGLSFEPGGSLGKVRLSRNRGLAIAAGPRDDRPTPAPDPP